MADGQRVTELTNTATVVGTTDLSYVVQGGVSKKITGPNLARSLGGASINVLMYGAVGNGSTDDTTAIQNAINACPENGVVVFPNPATAYKITTGLTISTNSVTLRGSGLTAFTYTGSGNALTITGTGCTVENIALSASGNGDYGIYLNGAYGTSLNNVQVWGFGKHQVYAVNAWWCSTFNCVFSTLDATAGYVAFYHSTDSNNFNHFRSRFVATDGNGAVYIEAGAQIGFYGCDISGDKSAGAYGLEVVGGINLVLNGCYFEWCDTAVHLNSSAILNARIVGCYFNLNDINGNVGVLVDGANGATIDDCVFYGNDPTYTSTGIEITTNDIDAQRITIGSNNSFYTVTAEITDAKKRAYTLPRIGANTTAPVDGGYWRANDYVLNSAPAAGERIGWVNTNLGYAVKESWVTGHSYTAGDFVLAVANVYVATTSGTAGATQPVHTSGAVSDGAVTWQFLVSGQAAAVFQGFGQLEHRTGTQSPDAARGNIAPDHIGELYFDSTNLFWYLANHVGARLWGSATAICGEAQLSSGVATVTFASAMGDTNYLVALGGRANETFYITDKAVGSFKINSSNGSSTAYVDWIVTR